MPIAKQKFRPPQRIAPVVGGDQIRSETQTQSQSQAQSSTSKAITAQESLQAVHKLLSASLGSILWLRALLPDNNFRKATIGDEKPSTSLTETQSLSQTQSQSSTQRRPLNVKLIREGISNEADTLQAWVNDGIMDAIRKHYLRSFAFVVFLDKDDPEDIVEAYTFNFDYNNGTVPSMTLSDRLGNVNLSLNKGQSSSNGAHPTPSEVKASIMRVMKNLIHVCQALPKLPQTTVGQRYVDIKLFYTEKTPANYQPPGFLADNGGALLMSTLDVAKGPQDMFAGQVKAGDHSVAVRVKSVAFAQPEHEAGHTDSDSDESEKPKFTWQAIPSMDNNEIMRLDRENPGNRPVTLPVPLPLGLRVGYQITSLSATQLERFEHYQSQSKGGGPRMRGLLYGEVDTQQSQSQDQSRPAAQSVNMIVPPGDPGQLTVTDIRAGSFDHPLPQKRRKHNALANQPLQMIQATRPESLPPLRSKRTKKASDHPPDEAPAVTRKKTTSASKTRSSPSGKTQKKARNAAPSSTIRPKSGAIKDKAPRQKTIVITDHVVGNEDEAETDNETDPTKHEDMCLCDSKDANDGDDWVQCDDCDAWLHGSCAGLSDVGTLVAEDKYHCLTCRVISDQPHSLQKDQLQLLKAQVRELCLMRYSRSMWFTRQAGHVESTSWLRKKLGCSSAHASILIERLTREGFIEGSRPRGKPNSAQKWIKSKPNSINMVEYFKMDGRMEKAVANCVARSQAAATPNPSGVPDSFPDEAEDHESTPKDAESAPHQRPGDNQDLDDPMNELIDTPPPSSSQPDALIIERPVIANRSSRASRALNLLDYEGMAED